MLIDIENLIVNSGYNTSQENHSTIARKIITHIISEKNSHYFINKVVVGRDIYDYLADLSRFHIKDFDINGVKNLISEVGNVIGMNIYIDNTYSIKPNEVLYFENEMELPFVKSYIRKVKMNRLIS